MLRANKSVSLDSVGRRHKRYLSLTLVLTTQNPETLRIWILLAVFSSGNFLALVFTARSVSVVTNPESFRIRINLVVILSVKGKDNISRFSFFSVNSNKESVFFLAF